MIAEECIKSILQIIKKNCEHHIENFSCARCYFYNKELDGECCFGWDTPSDFWEIEQLEPCGKELNNG